MIMSSIGLAAGLAEWGLRPMAQTICKVHGADTVALATVLENHTTITHTGTRAHIQPMGTEHTFKTCLIGSHAELH